jgi:hypothetical protein
MDALKRPIDFEVQAVSIPRQLSLAV